MRAVNIGIRHNNDFIIAQLIYIEVFGNSRAESHYYRGQLIVAVNLINSCLFNVEHFTPKRQNCLVGAVSALYRRAACRISLDYEYLCLGRVI